MAATGVADASWRAQPGGDSNAGRARARPGAGAAANVRALPPVRAAPPREAGAVDAAGLEELVLRMAHGEESALAAFYDAAVARVYGLALRLVRDAAAAEEVVVDAFHQAWRSAARFDAARGTPLAWLLVICRSRALDLLRARDPAVPHDDPEALRPAADLVSDADPLDLVAAVQTHAALGAALARLVPEQRQMLGLAFFRGLTHEEIAAHTTVPLGTVKSQIRRALAALRRELDSASGDAR